MGMKFFHLPRNRSFNIPYRFHNPETEEKRAREERIKKELKIDDSDGIHVTQIKGSFRSESKMLSKGGFAFSRNEKRKSNQRVLIIILVMLILLYIVFF
ncbi:hypothetical protein OAT16_01565 [Prolixibacteraceae bacterium]|nr:hypothetical protein [Prolixibacteraceae bacterium]